MYTQQLEVLLIERADKPGFWQSVTGSIESEDADLLATAARELMEETGIDAHQYQLQDWKF
ncbi:MAG: NUDIX domain-containing protein, partial [Methylophilaceae bacterium]